MGVPRHGQRYRSGGDQGRLLRRECAGSDGRWGRSASSPSPQRPRARTLRRGARKSWRFGVRCRRRPTGWRHGVKLVEVPSAPASVSVRLSACWHWSLDENAPDPRLRDWRRQRCLPALAMDALRIRRDCRLASSPPIRLSRSVRVPVFRTGRPLPPSGAAYGRPPARYSGPETVFLVIAPAPFLDDLVARRAVARLRPGGNAHVLCWRSTVSTASLRQQ